MIDMFPHINWLSVIASAAAGFAISMIFYFLPIMQKQRTASHGASENLTVVVLKRLWNTLLYAFAFAWVLSLTNILPMVMGVLLVMVGMLRAALTPEGWNRDLVGQPRTVRLVDNTRFILMYVVMTGIVLVWK